MEPDKKNKLWWKPALAIFSEVSAWVVVPIILALIAGKYLDEKYQTRPWIFLGLTAFAFLISSFGIVQTIRKYIKKEENGSQNESDK
jgi:hypothetical protein